MHVRYSPLLDQYSQPDIIFEELKGLVASGDYTLGKPVSEFEVRFAEILGVEHAIGVGSGTDACKIPLRAVGVGYGDEVITCANTFWATVGAICELGATPKFVDCDDSFCIDIDQIESAITSKTKAIMPVHLTGNAANIKAVLSIADRYDLPVVEDGCQSLFSDYQGDKVGTLGTATAFSMHPLKIINVWGDAGVIVTNDSKVANTCRLLRNHGLVNRDEMVVLGYNSRLDSIQAVVGRHILDALPWIVERRRENASILDEGFRRLSGVRLPPRDPNNNPVYLLYILFADRRDELLEHCLANGVEAKVHYPVPIYMQKAMKFMGHSVGDFPVTDRHSRECITLPVDQHLSREELHYMIRVVSDFYGG